MMLLPAAGMVVGALGAIGQGNANAAQLNGEAASHEYNARVADINKASAYQQGSAAEEQSRRESRQAIGAQSAAIAESGTGFGGSNAAIARQSLTNAEMDALNIRYGAALEATGHANQSQAERFNAKLAKAGAKSAKRAGYLNATAFLVNAGSDNYRSSGNVFGFAKS